MRLLVPPALIPRLIGKNAGCRPSVGGNTWVSPRVDSITVGDGHGSRSSSCRGWKGRSGCSIGRNQSVGRMLIDLVASSSLQARKFSLPFRCSHLLEGIRRNKVRMLFVIPSKKDFCVRRSTRSRSRQRRFSFLGFDVSLMSATNRCLKQMLTLIEANCFVLDMIK
jgi:hypothetical protein